METRENTKTLSVEDIISYINDYCDEERISLIKLCKKSALNSDLLYRMRRGGHANPTLSNINEMLFAIGKRLKVVDIEEEVAA